MSRKEKVLISACLVGENVKYNGKNNKLSNLKELGDKFELIPFCPEVEGGLPTPRPPAEIVSFNPLKLINKEQKDVTKYFLKGAKKCLKLCREQNIKKAILKANSPSCGRDFVYDGTFSGKLTKGKGVTADLLEKNGIEVFCEKTLLSE
ncbi:MAG: DUF523 domain-containing protein [Epsilonproteobacteria bacterium]|nr:DUF523 domain-containing protein [Campylobacterota bacterium]